MEKLLEIKAIATNTEETTMTRRKKTINLKDPEYQPSKAELEQTVRLDVPGRTTEEKMEKLAKAVTRPVNVLFRD